MSINTATHEGISEPKNSEGCKPRLLPFAEEDLLRVRVRPVDFGRMVGVDKSTVTRWIQKGHISLGADGRVDPEVAMKQLLRNGDPGQMRARLVRQAFADMSDLRAQANRAAELEQQLHELRIEAAQERQRDEDDYKVLEGWLDEFKRRIGSIPQEERGALDGHGWQCLVQSVLTEVMYAADELDAES